MMPLRYKIALPVALLVAATVLVVGWLVVGESVRTLEARTRDAQRLAVGILAGSLDYALREKMQLVEGISKLDSLRRMSAPQIDAYIRQFRRYDKSFTSLFVLDRNGRVVSFVDRPGLVGRDLTMRQYFQVARNERRSSFSDSILTVVDTITVIASTPIVDPAGEVAGVLAGSFDVHLQNFNQMIVSARIGASGHAYLVDRKGVVIAHPRTERALKQEDFSRHSPVQEALRGASGAARYDFEGVEMLAAYAPVPAAGWAVVLQQPALDALAPAEALKRWIQLASAVSASLAILLAVWIARRIAGPVRGLSEVAARIGRGDLEGEVPAAGNDEIGQLGRTLDSMREGLKASYASLRESEAWYRQFAENSPDAMFAQAGGRVVLANAAIEELLGVASGSLLGKAVLDLIAPVDREAVTDNIARVLQGLPVPRIEVRLLRFDSGSVPVELASASIRHSGEPAALVTARDVTERRRADEALRGRGQLADRLDKLVASVPGTVYSFRLRPDGSMSLPFASRRIREIYGLDPEELARSANGALALIHPQDAGRVRATVFESARTLRPWHAEWRVLHPEGREIWVEGHSQPVREADGSVLWHGFIHDVTAARAMQAALREADLRLRFAVAGAQLYPWEWNARTDEVVRMVLAPRESDPPKVSRAPYAALCERIHPEDRERFVAAGREALARNVPYDVEFRTIGRDARVRWFRAWGALDRDAAGGPLRMIGMSRDITERKTAQAALRESEERYRDLVEHIQDLISTHDLEGRILFANRASANLLGYSPEELAAMNIRDILAPAVRGEFDAYLAAIRRDGAASGLMRVITRSGETRIWEYHNTLRVGAASPMVRGLARDITERLRAERALKDLAQRVSAAHEDERLSIARDLHDDVGQALTAVRLNLQAVRRARDAADRGRALADSVTILDRAVERVRALSLGLRPELLDDLGLAPALDWYCRRQAERTGLAIALEAQPGAGRAKGPVALACYRIAQEAITNAVRHAHAGHVSVALAAREGKLLLEIGDDGAGFEAGGAVARESLGLLGMRERAELAGGTLAIESRPGAGTRVRAEFALGAA